GTAEGYYGINRSTGAISTPLQTRVPVQDISCVQAIGGKLWAGTSNGAFMKASQSYRYYASRRWLNEDKVKGIAGDALGNAYGSSSTGLNKIEFTDQTLLSKALYSQDMIRDRHIRYGFI